MITMNSNLFPVPRNIKKKMKKLHKKIMSGGGGIFDNSKYNNKNSARFRKIVSYNLIA